ncbi:MAG TPA: hypothetical protein VFT43_10370, partial [Candidatus Polarisedimenticolia bacterium]|nr:hypothetical protein [Candidatus Polarisedimenticolia bacterium]
PPPRLPVTERLLARVLVLPTGTAVSPQAIAGICGILSLVVSRAREAVRLLSAPPPRPLAVGAEWTL